MARETLFYLGWQKKSPATVKLRRSRSPQIFLILCVSIIMINYQAMNVKGQQRGDEVCETLPSEIHLIKGINNSWNNGES